MRPAPGLRLQAVPGALVPAMAGGESPWGWLVLCSVPQRSVSQLDQGFVTACLQAGLRWHLTVICSWWLSRAPLWCRYFKTQTWFLLGFEFESSQSLKQPAGARLCWGWHSLCLFCISLIAFYTSKYGYKMCLRVYLNGDGTGRGTHLSLFFVVMKGPNDALLRWPFNQKVGLGQSLLCPAMCLSSFAPT